jgi:hypothetical protein
MTSQVKQVKPLSPEQQALHDAALRNTGSADHIAKANFGLEDLGYATQPNVYPQEGVPVHVPTGLE